MKSKEQLLKEDIERRERLGFQGAHDYAEKEEELLEASKIDANSNYNYMDRPNRTLGVKISQAFGAKTSSRMQILRDPTLLIVVATIIFILLSRHHSFWQTIDLMFFTRIYR